ncbi:FxsA family protein [Magnetococcus sp. PR-3]|uniref:FxsA family protein n=1 Tax=Magnetococcus sp. PR-3 TaxID=3120355 RepID=UPI002FCDF79C
MRALLPLFILFFIALEIYVIAWVGDEIGGWVTFASIIGTAVVGIALVKHEGIKTLIKLQKRADQGEVPAAQLVDGVLLLFAGLMLLLPGFVSDAVGFLLALPFTRIPLRVSMAGVVLSMAAKSKGWKQANHPQSGVVEGEFTREEEQRPNDRRLE